MPVSVLHSNTQETTSAIAEHCPNRGGPCDVGSRRAAASSESNCGSTVMSTHSFTPVLEPKTQAFVDSLDAAGGPPLYTLTPDAARAVLADAQAAPIEKLPADLEDTTFPVGPTGSVKIRIV